MNAVRGRFPDPDLRDTVLADALLTSGCGPSLDSSHPWRWEVDEGRLMLYASGDARSQADASRSRTEVMSCGMALHHVCLTLAALGRPATVRRFPDPGCRHLLARVTAGARQDPGAKTMRLYAVLCGLHADRGSVPDQPDRRAELADLVGAAFESRGTHFLPLGETELGVLAVQAEVAARLGAADSVQRAELAYLLADREVEPQDRPVRYGLLFSRRDEPIDWLLCGEALSAAWLTAAEAGAEVLPLSSMIGLCAIRDTLRLMISGLGAPLLIMVLGAQDARAQDAGAAASGVPGSG